MHQGYFLCLPLQLDLLVELISLKHLLSKVPNRSNTAKAPGEDNCVISCKMLVSQFLIPEKSPFDPLLLENVRAQLRRDIEIWHFCATAASNDAPIDHASLYNCKSLSDVEHALLTLLEPSFEMWLATNDSKKALLSYRFPTNRDGDLLSTSSTFSLDSLQCCLDDIPVGIQALFYNFLADVQPPRHSLLDFCLLEKSYSSLSEDDSKSTPPITKGPRPRSGTSRPLLPY